MARIATYGGAKVGPVETTGARFRAPDMGGAGEAIGKGLQQLGGQLGDIADDQAKTRADDLLLQYESKARAIRADLKSKQNKDALDALPSARSGLQQLYDDTLAGADQVTRNRLQGRLDQYHGLYDADVGDYASAQERSYKETVGEARLVNFGENAIEHWDKPELSTQFIESGKAQIRENLSARGISDPEIVGAEEREYVSSIRSGVVDNLVSAERYEEAMGYIESHAGDLTAKDELQLRQRLKGPMDLRQADIDAMSNAPGFSPRPDGKPAEAAGSMFGAIIGLEGGTGKNGQFLTSPKGAIGPAQVMPKTAPEAAKLAGLAWDEKKYRSDPVYNKAIGEAYFKKQLQTFGDPDLAAAAYNAGPGAVRKALAKGGDPISHLPQETRDYVAGFRKRTAGGAEQQASRWDKEGWFGNIDAKADAEGWTFERRERAKERADRQIARDEQLLSRREAAADRQADEFILSRGEAFLDPSQIPRNVWSSMSTTARSQAINAAKANGKAKEPEANGMTIIGLHALQYSDPDSFAKLDLSRYVGQVTRAELDGLVSEKARLIGNGGPKVVSARSNISSEIRRRTSMDVDLKKALDPKKNPGNYSRLSASMETYISRATEGKRDPTDKELDAAFAAATRRVFVDGDDDAQPAFSVAPGSGKITQSAIPRVAYDRIRDTYRQRYGKYPDEGTIGRVYRENAGKPGAGF